MFDDMDEDNAKKLKYIIALGVGFIIFLVIMLFVMDVVSPNKKKRPYGVPSKPRAGGVTAHGYVDLSSE